MHCFLYSLTSCQHRRCFRTSIGILKTNPRNKDYIGGIQHDSISWHLKWSDSFDTMLCNWKHSALMSLIKTLITRFRYWLFHKFSSDWVRSYVKGRGINQQLVLMSWGLWTYWHFLCPGDGGNLGTLVQLRSTNKWAQVHTACGSYPVHPASRPEGKTGITLLQAESQRKVWPREAANPLPLFSSTVIILHAEDAIKWCFQTMS